MFTRDLELGATGGHALYGCPPGHDARVLAELTRRAGPRGLVMVCSDDWRAAALQEQLKFFAPQLPVHVLPAWDCLPYDRVSPSAPVVAARLACLAALLTPVPGEGALLLTTVAALSQFLPPPDFIRQHCRTIAPGATLDLTVLRGQLLAVGFQPAATVREVGEFALRGGIIDIFQPGSALPVRLDLVGDEVETIHTFDPATQRRGEPVHTLLMLPAAELALEAASVARFRAGWRQLHGVAATDDALYEAVVAQRRHGGMEHFLPLFHEQLADLQDYWPHALLVHDAAAPAASASRSQQIADFYQARQQADAAGSAKQKTTAYRPLAPGQLYSSWAEAIAGWREQVILFSSGAPDENCIDARGRVGRDFSDSRASGMPSLCAALRDRLTAAYAAQQRILLACASVGTAARLQLLLQEHDIASLPIANYGELARLPDRRVPGLVPLNLAHGFVAPDLLVISEGDLLGERQGYRGPSRRGQRNDALRLELAVLTMGDLVVHADHGIGRYDGLETIVVDRVAHDCLRLLYAGNDKLYLPVENLELLSRYGDGDSAASLDRLGQGNWQERKARIRNRLREMAAQLIALAAARAQAEAPVIDPPPAALQEFAARFPYVETEDQARAITAVLDDLQAGRPMDRLICGDVGFGKTEVAMRAAFAAIQGGLQVAVLVPTTLLARQHAQSFAARFASFPVRIGQLSRLVGSREQEQVMAALAAGTLDLVVGTHALLAARVQFARLGLLIVDEEQHFGVRQKERIKELRAQLHVLTLSATPIPRTLQMAMSGVRDLSLISTPPVDRLAVRTAILPLDGVVIRDALLREHYRGGQSFVVTPYVEDLPAAADWLHTLAPELRVRTVHGQLAASAMETIVADFYAGQFDILLSTNIIESGLDIPNANTLVVLRADRFGLAQLYQLRGRVGRSKQRGFAYLTWPTDARLTEAARRRLEVMETLDELGAGFQLASHDLDQRGAGNLLGEEQSGHIREVGIELYQQMLEEAVQQQRQQAPAAQPWTPQVNLGISVLIPENYVADLSVRMALYRRAAELADDGAIEALAAELTDRFGPLPAEVENLLQTLLIKHACRLAAVARLDAGPTGALLTFHEPALRAPPRLLAFIQQQGARMRLRPDQRLAVGGNWADAGARIRAVRRLLAELVTLNT